MPRNRTMSMRGRVVLRRLALGALCACSAAWTAAADTLIWSGGDAGALTAPAWTCGGTTRAPRAGDRLVVPAGTAVTAGDGDGALLASLSGIDLSGAFVCDGVGACTLPPAFSLSGDGAFAVLNGGAAVFRVNGSNAGFGGTLVVSNSFFAVGHEQALGTGPVRIHRGSLPASSEFFRIEAAGTYANALHFDAEAGWFGLTCHASPVIWSGPVTCTAATASHCPRFNSNGYALTLAGGMSGLRGRVDFNGSVRLSGEGVAYHAAEDIFCDNGSLVIGAPVDPRTKFVQATATVAFGKADVLNGVPLKLGGRSARIDLDGFSQTAAALTAVDQASASERPTLISSSAPATLTLSGGASQALGASLDGHVSLALDNAAASLVLTNCAGHVSTTDGELVVRAGTLRLGATATFVALAALRAEGGTLAVEAGACVHPGVSLALSGDGAVDLASGVALKVASLTLDGRPLAAGTYSAADPGALAGRLTGAGEVQVAAPGGEPATLVWQGGDGRLLDANWKAEGEAAAHVPYAGCRLSIPAGSKVTVEGDDGVLLARFRGVELDGELACRAFARGCTLDETFVLSGSGTLSVDACEGDFRLAADNSAFTGAFSFLKTRVYVDHVRALGIRNKVTASYGSEWPRGSAAYFRVNASGTFENDLSIDGGTGFWAYAVVGDHQVVQAGKVTCLNTTASPCPRFEALGGSALVFTGGIVGASGATAGRAVFNGNVTLAGTGAPYRLPSYFLCDYGNLRVSAVVGPATCLRAKTTISFGRENAVAGVALFVDGTGTFDLNGYDQTTDALDGENAGAPAFTSEAGPAMLTLNGAAAGGCLGAALKGHLSFAFDNAGGAVTLTNGSAGASTTDGRIVAKAGVLRLGATARLPSVSALCVAGGTLAVEAGARVSNAARMEFASGAGTLDLGEGVSLHMDCLTLDGAFLPKGTYSRASPGALAGRLSGDGELVIAHSTGPAAEIPAFHWVGGHGPALTTPENWRENAAPQLLGGEVLVFEGDAPGATVEGEIAVYGLVFDGTGDFTLGAGAGAGVTLGAGCFAVTNRAASGSATFTVQPPVVLRSSRQAWSVSAHATLSLPATLSAAPDVNDPDVFVEVSGAGTLDLGGDNAAFRPTWRFLDTAFVPVVRHPAALGASDRAIEVRAVPNAKVAMTNGVPFKLYASHYEPLSRHAFNVGGTHYDQRGKVTIMRGDSTAYLSLYGGTISGGIEGVPENKGRGVWLQVLDPERPFRIEGAPVDLPGSMVTLDNRGTFRLAVAGNHWNALRLNKTILVCERDNVLAADGDLLFSREGQGATAYPGFQGPVYGVLDMDGHPQSVRMLRSEWTAAYDENPAYADRRAYVTSRAPAALTLAGAYTNDSVRCAFCGAAGLTFAGSGRMRFTKWTSTTAGRLEIRSGELALDADGGWGGTNAVVAVSGGTLTVTATAARTAFGGADSRVSLELSGTGLIDVADGCVVDVGRMCVNGVPASVGEYGGVNAEGKKRFAAWFGAGRGLVRVRRGSSLVIVVR